MCKNLRLWYDKPAVEWETDALPIGNGKLGAMFFGGIHRERIQFNEETLYSGKPSEINEKAHRELSAIREFLANGDYEAAQIHAETKFLNSASYGDKSDFGAYMNFGDIYIDMNGHEEEISDYYRELNINNAIGKVEYICGKKKYKREYICSYPSKILAVKFTCSEPKSVSSVISIKGGQPESEVCAYSDGTILLNGTTGYIGFQSLLKIVNDGGSIAADKDKLIIKNADSFILYLSAATEYLPIEPLYKGNDYKKYNRDILEKVMTKSWEEHKKDHKEDYQELFNRVSLSINNDNMDNIPTDVRMKNYKQGQADFDLEMLLFQYGRYLLIGSSRQGTLPANLQGVWNERNDPTWGSIFCYNINFNMNYWPAEVTNLSECHEPAIKFIDSLRNSGRKSARAYFNANGWFTAKKSDVWGFTQPYAAAVNGLFIGGAGWLCQDVWEYYNFNRDEEYLKNVAYPIMKEAAEFYLDYLIENTDGYLVSCPSTSPENSFLVNNKKSTVSEGTEMDHRIIEELFGNCIKACRILNIDEEFQSVLEEKILRIAPTKIGKFGQIQEWYHDWDNIESKHRHMSHMYGVHPAQLITQENNPDLIEAVKMTMDCRGDEDTGWSRAWKINIWARLQNGNRAYKVLHGIISNKMHDNLFCIHPPFQIDGNFGYTAGVAEMLLQSNFSREIHILPALPYAWRNGSFTGLRARGGFIVDAKWENGVLINIAVHGNSSTKGKIKYKNQIVPFVLNVNGKFEYIF